MVNTTVRSISENKKNAMVRGCFFGVKIWSESGVGTRALRLEGSVAHLGRTWECEVG